MRYDYTKYRFAEQNGYILVIFYVDKNNTIETNTEMMIKLLKQYDNDNRSRKLF